MEDPTIKLLRIFILRIVGGMEGEGGGVNNVAFCPPTFSQNKLRDN